MAVTMTPEELADYIRAMPEDEILQVTFGTADGKEGYHGGEKDGSEPETV